MYRNIWKNCQSSVCQINFYSTSGIKLLSMTGFKANNQFLITDDYFFKIHKASEVEIKFFKQDGYTENACKRLLMSELKDQVIKSIDNKTTPFAAININFKEFENIPSLKLKTDEHMDIGQPIATLGFQLEKNNLEMKSGIISSSFTITFLN